MGVGAWLSRRLDKRPRAAVPRDRARGRGRRRAVRAGAVHRVRLDRRSFQIVLLAFVFAIGMLVGLELPLLMRMLEGQVAFKDLVSRVLTFDYIGALAAAVMFPLVLVPQLGLVRTSLADGRRERGVALWGTWLLARAPRQRRSSACAIRAVARAGRDARRDRVRRSVHDVGRGRDVRRSGRLHARPRRTSASS